MLTALIETLLCQLIGLVRRGSEGLAARRTSPALPVAGSVIGHTLPDNPGGKGCPVRLTGNERLRHLYALGSTGCGKTTLLLRLIESDIESRRTVVLLDLRGDLVDRILLRLSARYTPQDLQKRLVLLDLRQDASVVGFNPLAGSGESASRAMHVLSVLRAQSESWGVQLEETLRNGLMALAETGGTLLDLEPLLTLPPFREQVVSKVSDPYVQSFFHRFGELSKERQSLWALPVLNKVTPLLSLPVLRRTLAQPQGLPLRRILDDSPGSIVLVSLAADRLHDAAHLMGGLLVSSFQSAVMSRVDRPERKRVPVHLYIDEFETMASERFEAIIAEGRRFGVGLTLSHQNLTQLPQGLRQVVRNNVATQLFFRTGALDASELSREITGLGTAEEVKDALMLQPVGQAFLVRRGSETVRVQVPFEPDPPVDPAQIQAVRQAAYARWGRPLLEAEQEEAGRLRQIELLRNPPIHSAPESVIEVREVVGPGSPGFAPGAAPDFAGKKPARRRKKDD